MDERNAWKNFCESGKVVDYLNYLQSKEVKYKFVNFSKDKENANKNSGFDNKGTDSW